MLSALSTYTAKPSVQICVRLRSLMLLDLSSYELHIAGDLLDTTLTRHDRCRKGNEQRSSLTAMQRPGF